MAKINRKIARINHKNGHRRILRVQNLEKWALIHFSSKDLANNIIFHISKKHCQFLGKYRKISSWLFSEGRYIFLFIIFFLEKYKRQQKLQEQLQNHYNFKFNSRIFRKTKIKALWGISKGESRLKYDRLFQSRNMWKVSIETSSPLREGLFYYKTRSLLNQRVLLKGNYSDWRGSERKRELQRAVQGVLEKSRVILYMRDRLSKMEINFRFLWTHNWYSRKSFRKFIKCLTAINRKGGKHKKDSLRFDRRVWKKWKYRLEARDIAVKMERLYFCFIQSWRTYFFSASNFWTWCQYNMDSTHIEGGKGNIAFLRNFLYARCQVFSSLFYVLSSLFCFFSGRNFRGESKKLKQFTKSSFFPMEELKTKGLTGRLKAFEFRTHTFDPENYKRNLGVKSHKRNFRVKSKKLKQKVKTEGRDFRNGGPDEALKIGLLQGLVKAGYKQGSKEIVCFLKHRKNLLVVAKVLKEKNDLGLLTWEKLEENTKALERALEALKQGGEEKEISLLLDMIGLKEIKRPLVEFKGKRKL